MRRQCTWAAVVVGAMLAFAASAHADGLEWTPEWETAPVVQSADIDAALEAASAYWSRVPGVPHVVEACGTTPAVQVVRSDASGGMGRAARDGYPCRVWLTDTYLAVVPTYAALCGLIVHEIGHTLGLGHDFTGDPAMVMSYTFDGVEPADCSPPAASPTTRSTQASHRVCVPAWATATARTARLYRHGRKAMARRAYRTWKRTHKARAARLLRQCVTPV